MKDDEFAKTEKLFAPLVGQAILNFANIEYFTLYALEMLPNEAISRTASRLQFSQRVDLLIEILSARKETEAASKMTALLVEAKKLAEKRNIIAHNPLQIEIFHAPDKTEGRLPRIRHYHKREKLITQGDLVAFCAKADDVAARLWEASLEVLQG